jgi:hypothetical protein
VFASRRQDEAMFILRDDLAAIWPAPEKSKQPP